MSDGRPALDKSEKKGLVPGPTRGIVKFYSIKRPPFGGYITDEATGLDVFVHKSAVEQSGLGKLKPGQKISFDVIEDGFGGFKASRLVELE
jgi:CspA family cold shock protein